MNKTAPVNLARVLAWMAGLIIVMVPFHAFLTVWLSSLVGHYTLLRLWKEFLLVPIVLGAIYELFKNKILRHQFFALWLVRLIFIYTLLLVIFAVVAWANQDVTAKAMWNGLL